MWSGRLSDADRAKSKNERIRKIQISCLEIPALVPSRRQTLRGLDGWSSSPHFSIPFFVKNGVCVLCTSHAPLPAFSMLKPRYFEI